MADFISTLTGVQMDSALIDMAEHTSEAYAIGERNGVPVDSGDITYHNNARYYASQVQSIVPASVTEAVRWDIAQTALTDAQKAQARQNIEATQVGFNLLANSFFVVNSRGQSSYSATGSLYTVDRWFITANGTLTINSGYITVTGQAGGVFGQFLDNFSIGTQYTASVKLSDGTINSVSFSANAGVENIYSIGSMKLEIDTRSAYAAHPRFMLYDNSAWSVNISAVKLELGSVSTIAYDPVPDYGTELARCVYSTADSNDTFASNGFGIMNPNLLDNAWFGNAEVVNQRGVTSGTQANNAYFIDRWFWSYNAGAGTWSLAGTGLTFNSAASGYTWLMQKMENPTAIDARVLTASVLMSNGTIYYGTLLRANGTAQTFFNIGGGSIVCAFNASNQFSVRTYGSTSITVRAVKLEIGAVSTLRNDTPQDYARELAKCQRYCLVLKDPQPLGSGYFIGSGQNAYINVPLPTTMRAKPNISGGAYYVRWQKADGTMDSATSTTVNVATIQPNAVVLNITATGVSAIPCVAYASGTITLSADL